ncbi:MAG: hypothetical protein K9J12_18385 [Melioribacteraceae bacterium]|nr:hypothetical protein [Melioribacteraceae bacterium]MCF8265661.1 hypothetical protein [Melioribacteraceae bacterium]
MQLTFIYQLIGFLQGVDRDFNSINWRDSNRARQLLNNGKRIIAENPTKDNLYPIFKELFDLMPPEQRPTDDMEVLER